ncbi:MAG TPA: hypothetical protein VJ933_13080 [Phaeodactylibacter sp.]|jgi:hypothetical protein|nr:hypothetical protein [Phaeodactylibacter sp.]
MEELIIKFGLLDPARRQEILDFLDFLLSKQQEEKTESFDAYKSEILKVSTWSEKEIEAMQANSKKMNTWQVPQW